VLGRLVRSYAGRLYVHVPLDRPFDPDALPSSDPDDRWSTPAEPTIYLSSDPGVAIAEYGRHTASTDELASRRVLELDVDSPAVLDLRDPDVLGELGIDGGPMAFLDVARCRAIASGLRRDGVCEGILVPSVAFLDVPDRHNAVFFADGLASGPRGLVTGCREVARLESVPG